MDALGSSAAFAVTAGLVQGFVAAVLLRFRGLRPDWGLGWLAMSFALAAVLNLSTPWVSQAQRADDLLRFEMIAALIVGVSIMCALVVGVLHYTSSPRPAWPWTFLGVWLLYIGSIVGRKVWGTDPALLGNAITGVVFVLLSALLWRSHLRDPDSGHWVAALLVGAYPVLVALGWWWGLDQLGLRHWSAVPFALAGLGIMSAIMGRMRAELLAWNHQLEERVAQRTRELQDMLTSLESFSSMVSHDVKGTLGGISGLSRVAIDALQAGDSAKATRLFEAIARESDKMGAVVSDLLSLAKASQADVHKRTVSLAALLMEARQALALQHGDEVLHCIRHGALPEVAADPGLLRQVLVNLLSNALKFSREREAPLIEVVAQPDARGLTVQVRDNGKGFSPEQAQQLFQPFRRLDGAAAYEGSGVGLTIVRRIIERHGGRVWAEGRPGQGATFSFWLPA